MKAGPNPRRGLRPPKLLLSLVASFFFAAGLIPASLLLLLSPLQPPFGHFRRTRVAAAAPDDGQIIFPSSPNEEARRGSSGRRLAHADDGMRGKRTTAGRDHRSSAPPSVVDSTTLRGRVMAGYQGWFTTPGGGGGDPDNKWPWRHWSTQLARPNASNVDIDMWPDLREFHPSELTDTDLVYADGTNAGLYSARDYPVVRRHVKWMAEYGIDGSFVQRFVTDVLDDRAGRDTVLIHVMTASEEHGRVFANMYDISGYGQHPARSGSIVQFIKEDWMHLVDDLNVTGTSRYLRHNDRPVLAIWGFGLSDREGDASPSEAMELVQWLSSDPTTPERYRVTLMGGVDGKFRSHSNFPRWSEVYQSLDVVSPWTVGRYRDVNEADSYLDDHTKPDADWSTQQELMYMPVVYPGYSFYHHRHDEGKYDEIPRARGSFLWRQVCNAIVGAGVDMVYVAMFDEVNEGTAIYKVAEDSSMTPTEGRFVTLNEDDGHGVGAGGSKEDGGGRDGMPEKLPSDWYLRLAGEAGRVLRGEAGDAGRNATACRALVPPLGPLLPPKSSFLNG